MQTIKVSIVIAIYNTEMFLVEAIESVLSQSLKEFELILVNDGSSDNSKDICKKYSQENANVIYLEQENKGVSIARNNGLAVAKGEYIHFMDSDDSITENFIESSYRLVKKENADVAIMGEHFCDRFPNVSAFPAWALLISSDFLKRFPDIRFPEKIQPCEDGLFSHMLFAQSPKVVLNPNGVYNYRIHENQNHVKINENTSKIVTQIAQWFIILENYYSKYNLFKSKSMHLALFMQHEPFDLRYLRMSLNSQQKSILFNLIKTFVKKNILDNLAQSEKNRLHPLFCNFLESSDYKTFDSYYSTYQRNNNLKQFFIELIPIKRIRRKLRQQLKNSQKL